VREGGFKALDGLGVVAAVGSLRLGWLWYLLCVSLLSCSTIKGGCLNRLAWSLEEIILLRIAEKYKKKKLM